MDKKSAIGIFLVVIMLGSILPLFFSGSSNNNNNQTNSPSEAPGIDTIPGNKVSHQLNSIADGLAMSPENITSAQYVDYAKMHQSQLKIFVPNETELSTLYNVRLTKEFIAVDSNVPNGTDIALRMHEIEPKVVNFQYMASNEPYKGYYLLSRSEEYYNVVGSPMLFGSKESIENAIDVISGDASGSHYFDRLLGYTDPGAEYQVLSSDNELVADQYYLEFKALKEGGYARTSLFMNLNESVLSDINSLAQNSSMRGLEYNITNNNDITKVIVKTNESNFFNLALEPSA